MKTPLISIIIPLYNSEGYIEDCILSCLKQTYNNIEIIVIDDGSTDNGFNIVKELTRQYKDIQIIHQENHGVSSARNAGLKKANGDCICFIDADDCLDKRFVETMFSYMQKYNSDFCFSKNTYERGRDYQKLQPKTISSAEAEELLLSQEIKVGCWNKMYKKEMLGNILFREDLFYGEGLYFINQVAHNAKNIIVCEDGLYHYRKVNPESATTKFDINKMINGEKSLLEIKKMIKNDGKSVNRMWSQHYCLFCINTMNGILKTNSSDKAYKVWREKMRKNIPPALFSNGYLKTRLKILMTFIMPKLIIMARGK